jgi:hypothetical protein
MSSFINAIQDQLEKEKKIKVLQEILKKYPNNYNLGNFFANHHSEIEEISEEEGASIAKNHPNYYTLGEYLRNTFNDGLH